MAGAPARVPAPVEIVDLAKVLAAPERVVGEPVKATEVTSEVTPAAAPKPKGKFRQ